MDSRFKDDDFEDRSRSNPGDRDGGALIDVLAFLLVPLLLVGERLAEFLPDIDVDHWAVRVALIVTVGPLVLVLGTVAVLWYLIVGFEYHVDRNRLNETFEIIKTGNNAIAGHSGSYVFPVLSVATSVIAFYSPFLWIDVYESTFTGEVLALARRASIAPQFATFLLSVMTAVAVWVISHYLLQVAVVDYTADILQDETPSIHRSVVTAVTKLPHVVLVGAIGATAGPFSYILENRSQGGRSAFVRMLGVSYSVSTFFVLQAAVVDDAGPLTMFSRGIDTVRARFGDTTTISVGLFAIVFLLGNFAIVSGWAFLFLLVIGSAISREIPEFFLETGIGLATTMLFFLASPIVVYATLRVFTAAAKTVLYLDESSPYAQNVLDDRKIRELDHHISRPADE